MRTYNYRTATQNDVIPILEFQLNDPDAFNISDRIKGYEKVELEEWVEDVKNNIIYVVEVTDDKTNQTELIGFIFGKFMSKLWVMIDCGYIIPTYRGMEIGKQLTAHLVGYAKCEGVEYISTLVEWNDEQLSIQLGKMGFSRAKTYTWHEKFL